MERLTGKVALITGGARGQGAAEGRLFVEEGATVVLTDVLADEGHATAERIGATFFEHDVTDQDAWAAVVTDVVSTHGSIDVLVNNAGIFKLGGLTDADRDLWDTTIAINQTGVFLGMAAVVPTMTAQSSGSIINISSIAGYPLATRPRPTRWPSSPCSWPVTRAPTAPVRSSSSTAA